MPGRGHPSRQAARPVRARPRRAPRARRGPRLSASPLAAAHVVVSLVALGTNVAFPVVLRLAGARPERLVPALRAVRWVDRWVTIPGYVLTALTGFALVVAERIPPTALWVVAGTVLLAAAMAVGFVAYRPVSRRRLAAAALGGVDPAYRREDASAARLDAFILAAVLVTFALMVLRPR